MIGILAEIVVGAVIDVAAKVVGGVISSGVTRDPVNAVPHRQSRAFTSDQVAERRSAYVAWAAAQGLEQDDRRSEIFHGARSGRGLRFLSGLASDLPRPAEIEIAHPWPNAVHAIVLRPDAELPADVDAAIASVLDLPAVVQIDLTRKLVRLSFEPMAPPRYFEEPLEALLRALSPTITTTAYR